MSVKQKRLASISANAVKNIPKNAIEVVAKKKVVVEDSQHISEIRRNETFFLIHDKKARGYFLLDVDPTGESPTMKFKITKAVFADLQAKNTVVEGGATQPSTTKPKTQKPKSGNSLAKAQAVLTETYEAGTISNVRKLCNALATIIAKGSSVPNSSVEKIKPSGFIATFDDVEMTIMGIKKRIGETDAFTLVKESKATNGGHKVVTYLHTSTNKRFILSTAKLDQGTLSIKIG